MKQIKVKQCLKICVGDAVKVCKGAGESDVIEYLEWVWCIISVQ